MHPWEDWAETWAHYLHMFDACETARALAITPRIEPTPVAPGVPPAAARAPAGERQPSFDSLVTAWVPLTIALNSLNRSLGTNDGYPFVLSDGAIAKLRFVHDIIRDGVAAVTAPGPAAAPASSPGPAAAVAAPVAPVAVPAA